MTDEPLTAYQQANRLAAKQLEPLRRVVEKHQRPKPRKMRLQDIDHNARDWDDDCLFWWGRVLTGPDAHWCYDWDDLPIDATCKEYEACACFSGKDNSFMGMTDEQYQKGLDIL